jgi:hypothetical protein
MAVNEVTQAKPMTAFIGLSKRELPHVVAHLRTCFPGIQIFDITTGDKLAEEALLSIKSKVQKGLMDYLSLTEDKVVKSKTIKALLEELLGQSFSSALWSSAQKDVHVPGWTKAGHSWIRTS